MAIHCCNTKTEIIPWTLNIKFQHPTTVDAFYNSMITKNLIAL